MLAIEHHGIAPFSKRSLQYLMTIDNTGINRSLVDETESVVPFIILTKSRELWNRITEPSSDTGAVGCPCRCHIGLVKVRYSEHQNISSLGIPGTDSQAHNQCPTYSRSGTRFSLESAAKEFKNERDTRARTARSRLSSIQIKKRDVLGSMPGIVGFVQFSMISSGYINQLALRFSVPSLPLIVAHEFARSLHRDVFVLGVPAWIVNPKNLSTPRTTERRGEKAKGHLSVRSERRKSLALVVFQKQFCNKTTKRRRWKALGTRGKEEESS